MTQKVTGTEAAYHPRHAVGDVGRSMCQRYMHVLFVFASIFWQIVDHEVRYTVCLEVHLYLPANLYRQWTHTHTHTHTFAVFSTTARIIIFIVKSTYHHHHHIQRIQTKHEQGFGAKEIMADLKSGNTVPFRKSAGVSIRQALQINGSNTVIRTLVEWRL